MKRPLVFSRKILNGFRKFTNDSYHQKDYKISHPRDLIVFGSLFYLGAFLLVLERNGVENANGPSGVKAYKDEVETLILFPKVLQPKFFMNFAESLPKNCSELCSKFKSKNVFQPLFTSLMNLLGKNPSSWTLYHHPA